MGTEHPDGSLPAPPDDVLEAARVGTWTWDPRARTLTVDALAARFLGLPQEPARLTEAELRARVQPEDMVVLRSSALLLIAEGRPMDVPVHVVTAPDRPPRPLWARLAPGPADATGAIRGTLVEESEPVAERLQIEALNRAPLPAGQTAGQTAAQTAGLSGGQAAGVPQAEARLRRSREAFLLDAGRALAEATTTSDVLRVAASLAMPGFSPDELAVFGVEGNRLTVVGHHGRLTHAQEPFQMPLDTAHPAAEAARTGRPVYISSPQDYRRRYPAVWPLVSGEGRRAWAVLPLTGAGRTTGAWLAAFSEPVAFSSDERAVLGTVARMLSQALERAHSNESERALSRGLARSMRTGAPQAGLSVATRYVPTGGGLQVGGDWYDVITLPDGRLGVVIGDVQGHDVHAAGLMAQLRTAVHAYAAEGHRPDAVLARASRFLAGIDEDRFATCLYIEADPETGMLEIARAGHPHPVVRLPDGTCLLRHVDGGLPLGLMPDGDDYPVTRMQLQTDEILMLCTDGLVETGGHDWYTGWIRVRDAMSPAPADDLEGMADALITAVHGPASHRMPGNLADRREDDIALLLLRRDALPGQPGAEPDGPERRIALTVGQDQPERLADARQEIRGVLHDWAQPEQVDAGTLLVSELLANVLVHTDRDAALLVEVWGARPQRRLRVEVADSSDDLPHRRSPGEMSSSGRGLMLLDILADQWGVLPRGDGKCIWFELHEAPTPAAASAADLVG
ncbi:SpoIIE family protein phosphatase [Streptacidiphilus jiangxiensis]|uniref:protein-serine/threonine phosphatase n=1 Tax=Streptacidiphilus jiangxiensis TaxID=235985 RepID=A0A1H7ZYQ0_STRJI|nr:SpoIIE family protein phosphatase [Streptacidiphilus jiangxiensis]SEM63605.1 GAF domain-containing protein [Streptacidiphilus jiangxiensis]